MIHEADPLSAKGEWDFQLTLQFRADCEKAAKEYADSKDAVMKSFENRMMKLAKDDEEKAAVAKIMEEARKES